MATPFVQGQLRQVNLTASIATQCAHCGQSLYIEIDQDLKCRLAGPGARPLIAVPLVDFARLKDPSIIDAF